MSVLYYVFSAVHFDIVIVIKVAFIFLSGTQGYILKNPLCGDQTKM